MYIINNNSKEIKLDLWKKKKTKKKKLKSK